MLSLTSCVSFAAVVVPVAERLQHSRSASSKAALEHRRVASATSSTTCSTTTTTFTNTSDTFDSSPSSSYSAKSHSFGVGSVLLLLALLLLLRPPSTHARPTRPNAAAGMSTNECNAPLLMPREANAASIRAALDATHHQAVKLLNEINSTVDDYVSAKATHIHSRSDFFGSRNI